MLHLRASVPYAGLTIGLLGGSFNPVHQGHLDISLHALKRLGVHQVWWLVSPQNPLKSSHETTPLVKRMAEARKRATHPRINVTDIESQLGTCYTIDTLRALKKRFPRTQFVWLMGADNLRQLPRWREWGAIFRLVPIAVFRRPAYSAGRGCGKAAQRFDRFWRRAAHGRDLARMKPPAWMVMDNRLNSLSSTGLRKERAKW